MQCVFLFYTHWQHPDTYANTPHTYAPARTHTWTQTHAFINT